MEDVTDMHLLKKKKKRYTITFFYPYFIAGVHIIIYILF